MSRPRLLAHVPGQLNGRSQVRKQIRQAPKQPRALLLRQMALPGDSRNAGPCPPPPPALIPVAASGGSAASVQIVCKNLRRPGKRPLLKLQQDVGREASGWCRGCGSRGQRWGHRIEQKYPFRHLTKCLWPDRCCPPCGGFCPEQLSGWPSFLRLQKCPRAKRTSQEILGGAGAGTHHSPDSPGERVPSTLALGDSTCQW